jgi:UDP-glucose 4-epimerase
MRGGAQKHKVLVTGGVGYIGSHTVLELLEAGHEVIVVDNLCNSNVECLKRVQALAGRDVAFHNVDIRDTESLGAVFDQHKPDSVIHFAGLKVGGAVSGGRPASPSCTVRALRLRSSLNHVHLHLAPHPQTRPPAPLGSQAVGESVSQPLLYYQVNVQGTLNLIASMLATGCRNIVFSSSATVYGEPASVPVNESFPVGACTNPYGAVF